MAFLDIYTHIYTYTQYTLIDNENRMEIEFRIMAAFLRKREMMKTES